jgi:hypothetical protein
MLLNIAIAALMMVVTTAIHAVGIALAALYVKAHERGQEHHKQLLRLQRVGGVALLMLLLSLVEVSLWAAVYMLVGAFQSFEPALYFSTVSFTTLGYGDVLLDERWRLMGSFEAANGIIIFGLSTAVVVATVQRVYFRQDKAP